MRILKNKLQEKEGEFLGTVETLIKIGEHKIIIVTIHMITKFSLSVNTHYPEYGEEVIGFI